MSLVETSIILNGTIQYAGCERMLDDLARTLETIRKREQDIEIMQLQLKHNLTKKRAESKLLIMYYKTCNTVSRAKLLMYGISSCNVKALQPPELINRWDDHRPK